VGGLHTDSFGCTRYMFNERRDILFPWHEKLGMKVRHCCAASGVVREFIFEWNILNSFVFQGVTSIVYHPTFAVRMTKRGQ
jgi:hypothetical protein